MNRRHFIRTAAGGVTAGNGRVVRPVALRFVAQPRHETHRQVSCDVAGLGPDGANNLGNYIPVLSPDTKTYPGTTTTKSWLDNSPRRCIPA
jgi:hypothetical protein